MQYVRSRSLLPLVLIVGGTFLFAGLTFLLPVADTAENPTATHWRTAAGTAVMVLFLGAGFTFLSGLRLFKPDLRVAYRLMSAGIIAFSLALIQLVIWGVLDLWESAWAVSGSGLIPYVLTAGLIYAGARKFARMLGIKTWLTSYWLVIGVSVAVSVVMGVLASSFVQYELEGVETYIAVGALCSTVVMFAALLSGKIAGSIGEFYKPAMRWLTVGLWGLFVAAAHETLNTFWFNNGDPYTDFGYYLIPFVLAGVLLVRASYSFLQLSPRVIDERPTQSAGGLRVQQATPIDYKDSILAVAGLVSRPEDIGFLHEDLRFVSVSITPETELSTNESGHLIEVYRSLEKYLTQKDALRTFTADEVRRYVTPSFRALL